MILRRYQRTAYNPKDMPASCHYLNVKIFRLMSDGRWWTLAALHRQLRGYSQAGISASVRSLRSPLYGGYAVAVRFVGHGLSRKLYEYRLCPPGTQVFVRNRMHQPSQDAIRELRKEIRIRNNMFLQVQKLCVKIHRQVCPMYKQVTPSVKGVAHFCECKPGSLCGLSKLAAIVAYDALRLSFLPEPKALPLDGRQSLDKVS